MLFFKGLHTGNSKAAINEILSQNIQGVFGKDLVNMFTSDPTNRLEIKKLVNTVSSKHTS